MATSNKMYPKVVIRRIIDALIELNQAAAQYTPTNLRTIWPALILAAKRNDKVNGRTIILVDSIKTRNGFSQSGAPSGKKWAIDALGFLENLEIIIDNHSGNPNLNVKIKWLDKLNIYGIKPNRLIIIITTNKGVIKDLMPFKLYMKVRDNWIKINEFIGEVIAVLRDELIQNIDCIDKIIKIFKYKNSVVDGI